MELQETLQAIRHVCQHTHTSERKPHMLNIVDVSTHTFPRGGLSCCMLWAQSHPCLFERQHHFFYTPYVMGVTTPTLLWDSYEKAWVCKHPQHRGRCIYWVGVFTETPICKTRVHDEHPWGTHKVLLSPTAILQVMTLTVKKKQIHMVLCT